MTLLKRIAKEHLSWLSICIFFFVAIVFSVLFFIQRDFMTNIDERDHLIGVFQMMHGRVPYRDFFTNHFPLPYYWEYIFSPLWGAPARTIAVFRLSLLVAYLLTFISVFLAFKNTYTRLVYSFWIFLLSLFFTIYHGNLVLSETFAAIFIGAVFWLLLPIILKWETRNKFNLSLIVVFASFAFWTQPLLIFLLIIPFLLAKKEELKVLVIIMCFLNLIFPVIFFLNNQLNSFIEQTIWFNYVIYSKYSVDNLPPGNIFMESLVYFVQNQFFLLTHFFNSHQLFQFLINIPILVLFYKIFKDKKIISTLSLLLIFVAVHVREGKIIPGQPFNFGIYPLLTLGAASFAIMSAGLFNKMRLLAISLTGLLIFICLINFRPIFQQSLIPGYNYHVFWSYRQERGELLGKLAGPSGKVLVYPHDIDLYYFANSLPPDRFTYWFPWINSVPKYYQERLVTIKDPELLVLYIGGLAYKNQPNLYAEYFPDLKKGYLPVMKNGEESGVYVKESLKDQLNPF